jgi:putative transposase
LRCHEALLFFSAALEGLNVLFQPAPRRSLGCRDRGATAMARTFNSLITHLIFSTKDRLPLIAPGLKPDLHAYIGGIIRKVGGKALAIGGTADHVHLLISAPPALSISEILRKLKANSSKWVNENHPKQSFAWQAGYGAFSVSHSNVPAVISYIQRQVEHHRRVSFQEELVTFLKKHGIEYDERYIWE